MTLSDSILILFPLNPGDLSLQAYIEAALQDGLLNLRAFVAVFLQAAKSPNLQEASTLDNLCRLILNHHYASGLSPNSSFMRVNDSTSDVMPVVHDSLALLRATNQIPSSPYHALTSSAGQLAMLLIHCVGDLSQVSNQQIVISYATVLDILQSTRLDGDVRNGLENLMMSLSLLIGDDVKMAQEVQVMQTMQVSLGRTDATGSNTPTDLASCSFLLRHLVNLMLTLLAFQRLTILGGIPHKSVRLRQYRRRCCGVGRKFPVVPVVGFNILHSAVASSGIVPCPGCLTPVYVAHMVFFCYNPGMVQYFLSGESHAPTPIHLVTTITRSSGKVIEIELGRRARSRLGQSFCV